MICNCVIASYWRPTSVVTTCQPEVHSVALDVNSESVSPASVNSSLRDRLHWADVILVGWLVRYDALRLPAGHVRCAERVCVSIKKNAAGCVRPATVSTWHAKDTSTCW